MKFTTMLNADLNNGGWGGGGVFVLAPRHLNTSRTSAEWMRLKLFHAYLNIIGICNYSLLDSSVS